MKALHDAGEALSPKVAQAQRRGSIDPTVKDDGFDDCLEQRLLLAMVNL